MATDRVDILVRVRNAASASLRKLRGDIGGVGAAATAAGGAFSGMGAKIAALAAAYLSFRAVKEVIGTFAEFDDTMRAAGAVTGATTEEMERMRDVAKELGATTRFTARQAADGYRLLGMAGFTAAEATQALPGVLNLAASGMVDVGTAADIATNILQAYGLEVQQLSSVNDVLVKTFTSSNTTVNELGEAFKLIGPIAKGVGADFEELFAAIGKLGDAGLKGTLAGTALRGAINALLNPTNDEQRLMKELGERMGGVSLQVKDAQGNFIGFTKIVEQLEKAGLRGDEALRLFGLRAGPGMAALMQVGSKALRELDEELKNAGGISKKIASDMEAGLGGAMRRLKAASEGVKIALGDAFQESLIDVVDAITGAVQRLIRTINQNRDSLGKFGKALAFIVDTILKPESSEQYAARMEVINRNLQFQDKAKEISVLAGELDKLQEKLKEAEKPEEEKEGITWHFGLFDTDPETLKRKIAEKQKEIDTATEAARNMYDELLKAKEKLNDFLRGPGVEEQFPVDEFWGGPVPVGTGGTLQGKDRGPLQFTPTLETNLKNQREEFKAELEWRDAIYERWYDKQLIDTKQYYDAKKEIARAAIENEIKLLEYQAAELKSEAEQAPEGEDVSKTIQKYLEANGKIKALRIQLGAELIKLDVERGEKEKQITTEKVRNEQDLNNKRLAMERAFAAQKLRIEQYSGYGLEPEHNKELADLQTRQDAELNAVTSFWDKKYSIEQEGQNRSEVLAKIAADKLNAVYAKQSQDVIEKTNLVNEQTAETAQKRLKLMGEVAGGVSQIFQNMYELSGSKNQELFRMAKALAIAEATMNLAVAISAVMKKGTIGLAEVGTITAQGAQLLATINSASLAEGGFVPGRSPTNTSDDKLVAATSGEFMQPVSSVDYYGARVMEGLRQKTIPREIFSGFNFPAPRYGHSRFAEGGMVEGGVKMGMGDVAVRLENNSREELEVTQGDVKYDQQLKKFVIDVYLDAKRRNVSGMRGA